jgi:hypothetical protein
MSDEQAPVQDVAAVASAALGLIGAALSAYFTWLFWRVLSGPGDDNPIGMAFGLAAGLALIPAWGLIRFFRRQRFSWASWLWLVGALAVTALLVPFAGMFAR